MNKNWIMKIKLVLFAESIVERSNKNNVSTIEYV